MPLPYSAAVLRRPVLLACALAATLAVAPAAAQGAAPKKQLYVSLGDSYASGYQPNARSGWAATPATASPTRCPPSRPPAATGFSS